MRIIINWKISINKYTQIFKPVDSYLGNHEAEEQIAQKLVSTTPLAQNLFPISFQKEPSSKISF